MPRQPRCGRGGQVLGQSLTLAVNPVSPCGFSHAIRVVCDYRVNSG
jgi:hypothetical protein